VSAFQVKLGANDLNCVDVLLNPTHSLTVSLSLFGTKKAIRYVDGKGTAVLAES